MIKDYSKVVNRYGVMELVAEGPSEGNPFTDQWVRGTFESPSETKTTAGFYDGAGIYRIRFMPSFSEEYLCTVETSWGETEKVTVSVEDAEEGIRPCFEVRTVVPGYRV